MSSVPISLQEITDLSKLDISREFFKFNSVTLESDKFLCVRENAQDKLNVVIVDLNDLSLSRRKMQADSVIMNPSTRVLALRSEKQLQIFNIEMKSKMKSFMSSEEIVFWKWISVNTLGFVTPNAVFHWSMEGTSEPKKVFDRHSSLVGHQILNYQVDPSNKWMVLVGISSQEKRINGKMQLFNVDKQVSQVIDGHCAVFSSYLSEGSSSESVLFCFANKTVDVCKLHILEIVKGENSSFQKKVENIPFPSDAVNDFPVAVHLSRKFNMIFLVTMFGYFFLIDIESGSLVFKNRISTDSVFISTPCSKTDGLLLVNKSGQVLSLSIDENKIVPFLANEMNNTELALRIARRSNLVGAEDIVVREFQKLFQQNRFVEAAKIAAESPRGVLRTPQTVQMFLNLPQVPNQPAPLLQYFGILLDAGKLNAFESIELTKPVLAQGRKELIEDWLKKDKLECSEELGDLLKPYDETLALSVYLRANISSKVVASFVEIGTPEKAIIYSDKLGYAPDWMSLFEYGLRKHPEKSVSFASALLNDEKGPLLNADKIVSLFVENRMIQEATTFLLEYLKEDLPEHADLQSTLLEINLSAYPQVADAILKNKMFSHFDHYKIGQLCEQAKLYQHALENFEDLKDIERVLLEGANFDVTWVVDFFRQLESGKSLSLISSMLSSNVHLDLILQICIQQYDAIGVNYLLDLFEKKQNDELLFNFLHEIVNFCQEPFVHFKYIVQATKLKHFKEVERICKDSNFYDPQAVKEFLMEAHLPDQLPLIIVCDRFNFVSDLTHFLVKNNMMRFVEIYVQKVNPQKAHIVVGALLDLEVSEEIIRKMLFSVQELVLVEEVIKECEVRGRLGCLKDFLKSFIDKGSQVTEIHNAFAKVLIDANDDAQHFLLESSFYDCQVIGAFCEKRDAHLAYLVYEKGHCDQELIRVCQENSMFKNLAKYLIQRMDTDLWSTVLKKDNPYFSHIIEQVIGGALPEIENSEMVFVTVKSFMINDLQLELIELLEKIVLNGGIFSEDKNLQNLLILTAIKVQKDKVVGYINCLNNYDALDIANIAIGNELFEEAFQIYDKFSHTVNAISVLLNNLSSIPRALEYAERFNQPELWAEVGLTQLKTGAITDSIESFLKAEFTNNYKEIIEKCKEAECFDHLIKYLRMVKNSIRDSVIESELVYAFAKVENFDELEEFLSQSSHPAAFDSVGQNCFEESLFKAAKLIFTYSQNYSMLACTFVKLGNYQGAVDAARKANSMRTWKFICTECLTANESRLAYMCGLHIIVHPEELSFVVNLYERCGKYDELINLLESGIGLERAHKGIFTELGVIYCKYKQEKLLEHIKLFWTRFNITKIIQHCLEFEQWSALTLLYSLYEDYDNCVFCMIKHPVHGWDHVSFKDIIRKVSNQNTLYEAVDFYFKMKPELLNDLLFSLSKKVDFNRIIEISFKYSSQSLIQSFLKSVQSCDSKVVNETLNQLFIEEEDFHSLAVSVNTYRNFDHFKLCAHLEKHVLLEFRRIAAALFKQNEKWEKSLLLSQNDGMFQDAICTAAESHSTELCEELLLFFLTHGEKECFSSTLFSCYDFVRPDVVLELAWKYQAFNEAFPYFIQFLRDISLSTDSKETDI
eukprot:GCRY01001529.1.p1 GENE.GCRY01001529.1~~GCRY01001529.1.p1  ORF type:complete len:1614 (+),score=231.96 GCRY01001529.1:130-4971(+)